MAETAAELWDNNYDVPFEQASEQDRKMYEDHAESVAMWKEHNGRR